MLAQYFGRQHVSARNRVTSHAQDIFISYCHDSPEHSARVLALAWALRSNGIAVELDQFHEYVHRQSARSSAGAEG
ncbi:MAG: SEFIR domain-containing protein [Gammaproteobacteria bacterium]